MISRNAERIKESLNKVAKVSKKASFVFKILLIGYLVVQVIFFCYSAYSLVTSGLAPSEMFWVSLRLVTMLLSIAVGALVFMSLMQVFGNIGSGISPFTLKQSNRLKLIGALLLVDALLGILISMAPLPDVQIGLLTLGLESPKIDLTPILGSIIFFCFSYVFKYGSLLQQLSDDTV